MQPVLVLFASSLAISVYSMLDTEMLGFMRDYEQVGYYGRAMNISKMLVSAVTSISIVVIPRVAQSADTKNYAKIEDIMNKSFSVVSFLAIPMSVGLCCIAPVFVPLFFGNLFVGASIPMMIMAFDVLMIGLNNLVAVQGLIGMGYDNLFLKSVMVGAFSNVLLNLFLIPRFGAIGASTSSVMAEFLVLMVSAIFLYRATPVRIHNLIDLVKGFGGALLFIPLLFLLKTYLSGWVLVVVFVVSGALLYFVVEGILKNGSVSLLMPLVKSKLHKR